MAGPRMILGQNQYGKAENRVVKITRDGGTHRIRDLNVSVALRGDFDDVHYSGSNANVLPTDTTKNTVFAFAKEHGIDSPEQFGIALARHFVDSTEPVSSARIRIEEHAWDRIETADGPAPHSFVRSGREIRTAQVTYGGGDGGHFEVLGGIKGLTVLNSTDSEFWGFIKDKYTTLQEDRDRILATEVSAVWRHGWTGTGTAPRWEESYEATRSLLLRAFAETYSLSLQQTLYQMGAQVLGGRGELDEIRFSMPNKHHFRVDLEPFGVQNEAADGAVYFAADRPYGLIEATVLRDGAEALIPPEATNL